MWGATPGASWKMLPGPREVSVWPEALAAPEGEAGGRAVGTLGQAVRASA